jgi:hypothetical protein
LCAVVLFQKNNTFAPILNRFIRNQQKLIKKMKKNLFLLMMIAFVATISLTSCGPDDPCKDVDCGQNAPTPTGDCVEGECVCAVGYEGTGCATEASAKFVGKWYGKDVCTITEAGVTTTATYTLDPYCTIARISQNRVSFTNLGGLDVTFTFESDVTNETDASLTANVVTFDYTEPAASAKKRTIKGTGILTGTKFTGSYTVTYADFPNDKDVCTFDYAQ